MMRKGKKQKDKFFRKGKCCTFATNKKALEMTTELVIFDLDGTLLNTIGDLAASCDVVLAKHGLPQHTYEEYCHFVGNGILRLVERAIPLEKRTKELVEQVRRDFVAYYTEHIDIHTRPYEGIVALLEELQRRGVKLAVASNKFQAGTEKLVQRYFPEIHFDAVYGQRPDVALKPDPQIVYDILNQVPTEREKVLYVGDSGVDIETAQAAGLRNVGCSWGFRQRAELIGKGADHVVDHAAEILEYI